MADRPNIILINCDDLGYGDLGCYGSKGHDTPALDKMAAEGMRYTDFYMASPVCSPSRGAMMTGCYPRRISFGSFENNKWVLFPGDSQGLSQDETTIAKLLKQQGYATKLVGKWHCGDQPEFLPTNHGFDSYYGIPFSNDMGRQSGRKKQYPPLPLVKDQTVIQEQPDQAALTERYLEQCVSFIRENAEGPFFLYLAHMYVHLPLYAPDRFMRASRNGSYGAAVACVDWTVEVLMHELRRLGLAENTLVVFTSDNGSRARSEGGSNAPLRGRKGETWEGGMRVPCIAWWPGRVPAGEICTEITASIDFLPTFAAIAGAEPPRDRIIDGKDVSATLFQAGAEGPRDTFFYYDRDVLDAVRHGKWKLHVAKGAKPTLQLYDLRADIAESTNVAEQHPDVVDKLQGLAQACRDDIGDQMSEVAGANVRPCGVAKDPKPLTQYDPDHPYYIAMYDLNEAG